MQQPQTLTSPTNPSPTLWWRKTHLPWPWPRCPRMDGNNRRRRGGLRQGGQRCHWRRVGRGCQWLWGGGGGGQGSVMPEKRQGGKIVPQLKKYFPTHFALARVVSQICPSSQRKCHIKRDNRDTLSPLGKNHVLKSVHLSPYSGRCHHIKIVAEISAMLHLPHAIALMSHLLHAIAVTLKRLQRLQT